jgi:hypothetical protein
MDHPPFLVKEDSAAAPRGHHSVDDSRDNALNGIVKGRASYRLMVRAVAASRAASRAPEAQGSQAAQALTEE